MMSRVELRMAHTVRCPDGTVLQKGERVERFSARFHRKRLRSLGQLESANVTALQMARRAEGDYWLQPEKILAHGKLLVVERQYLQKVVTGPPTNDRPAKRVRFRQGELLD